MGIIESFEEYAEKAGLLERQPVLTTDIDTDRRLTKDYRGPEARHEGEVEVLMTDAAEQAVEQAQRTA